MNRPFFFMVPFWGERYRRYFLELLLPSLLAPGNLPQLRSADDHRFLIATTDEDWNAIADHPLMVRLAAHAPALHVQIPPPDAPTAPGATSAILHQNLAQKRLVEFAWHYRAKGCLFSPDCIISDGMVLALVRRAARGETLVRCPALRHKEETCLAELANYRPTDPSAPLVVPPRALADMMVRNLHPEVAIFEEGHPAQMPIAPLVYWRIPGGMVMHNLYAAPVLMDYSAIDRHDTNCLKDHIFEEDYVARNFADCPLNVVTDSDEFCILSVTPAAEWAAPIAPTVKRSRFMQRCSIAASLVLNGHGLRQRRELFRQPIIWHDGDIDKAVTNKIARIVSPAFRPHYRLLGYLLYLGTMTPWAGRWIILRDRLARAMRGDRKTWAKIVRRFFPRKTCTCGPEWAWPTYRPGSDTAIVECANCGARSGD